LNQTFDICSTWAESRPVGSAKNELMAITTFSTWLPSENRLGKGKRRFLAFSAFSRNRLRPTEKPTNSVHTNWGHLRRLFILQAPRFWAICPLWAEKLTLRKIPWNFPTSCLTFFPPKYFGSIPWKFEENNYLKITNEPLPSGLEPILRFFNLQLHTTPPL
jgi:hypothetical protein